MPLSNHSSYVEKVIKNIYFLKKKKTTERAQGTVMFRWVQHWNGDNDLTIAVLINCDGAILVGIDFMPKHDQSLGSAAWLAPAWRRLVSGTAICFSCQRQQARGQDLEGEKLEKKLKSKRENEEVVSAKDWRLTEKLLQKKKEEEINSAHC